MGIGYFILCALILSITLNIIYFSKKHIPSHETKIFSKLLFINQIGLIIEFSCMYVSYNFPSNTILSTILTRLYLIYLITYLLYMTLYIYVVCYISEKQENIDYYQKLRNISYIIYFICLTLCLVLPITTAKGYALGKAVDFVYICSTLCITIWFIPIIKNKKIINFKKFIPLFFFILLIIIIAIIQKIYPQITLITSMEFLIIFIMYHTIENPDVKVLEEVHRAKKVSDNANEEKTMFLYNMTNEIRGITKEINREADYILEESNNKNIDVEVINDSVREIKSSIAKFTTITNELLDISNIDSATIKIYNEKYNIELIIKELINTYKKKCSDKNITFRDNVASDIPNYLYGDGINLKKVLNILLDNSTKYTEEGYVELDVNTIIKNDIVRLMITVENSGLGIKTNELEKLFTNKIDSKKNNNLYNAKRLITLMGGTIIPSSIYGKSTTIKIVLDQKIANDNDKLNKYEKEYAKKEILLIGDNNEKIIAKLLKDKNVNLCIVKQGKIALDKIREKEKYDLILLEEDITPLNGLVIMKKLTMIRMFNTDVILLTKNKDYIEKDKYKEYGFCDCILEPIEEKSINIIDKYLK